MMTRAATNCEKGASGLITRLSRVSTVVHVYPMLTSCANRTGAGYRDGELLKRQYLTVVLQSAMMRCASAVL